MFPKDTKKSEHKKIYDELDSKNVSVNIHTHDRNMAINKFVREREHGLTRNQNVFGMA